MLFCGDLTILLLGLIIYCLFKLKRKLRHSLRRPSRSDLVQSEFDEEAKMYAWAPLGCGNYAPNFFGTSVPEVVEVRENPDGTVTLTVNAVCDMVICDDALITHDLTVKFKEDESFQYLGNEIRKEDRNNVPEYQYRVKGEIKNGS